MGPTSSTTNYHRLMLAGAVGACQGARVTCGRRGRSAWQPQRAGNALLDPASGQTPNLGPNDSTYIQPLTQRSCADYRPVLQAAGRAFLAQPLLSPGPWDDLGLWWA
jgi:hypothetical protein